MDNRPVGFFDSGLGGLTAVSALRKLLPNENIIYFGDTGRMPYGTRERKQLRGMARQNLEYLMSFDVKAIIAACGTMSANATDILDSCPVPVFNVLVPSVEAMSHVEGDQPLAIIATEASIRAAAFQNRLQELCPGREILGVPCQDFVILCETGHISPDDELLKKSVEGYLRPVKEKNAAALLLGCTHFGIISEAISDYLGRGTEILSASECAAKRLEQYLIAENMTGGNSESRYFTSGLEREFDALAAEIMGNEYCGHAEHVPVMTTEVEEC